MDWRHRANGRSDAAASMSLEGLIEGCEHVYLWTLTFARATDRPAASKAWNHFMALTRQHGINLRCIKVYEVHPGGHGIHIHFITPDYHNIHRIRPLRIAAGFGRDNVKKIAAKRAGYVLKYITKAIYERQPALKGAQMWRAIGKDRKQWAQTIRSIHIDTSFTRAWHWLKASHPGWSTMRWFERKMMTERLVFNAIVDGPAHFLTQWDWIKDSLGVRQFVKVDAPF